MKHASSTDEQTDDQSVTRLERGATDKRAPTRRRFLQSAAATGALAAGFSAGSAGTVSAATTGIPTPRLHVEGNLIKDPQGNTVTLRGLNIADPKRLNVTAPARGKAAEHVVDLLTDESQAGIPESSAYPPSRSISASTNPATPAARPIQSRSPKPNSRSISRRITIRSSSS